MSLRRHIAGTDQPGLAGAPWDGLRIAQENESRAAERLQSGARLYWTPVQASHTDLHGQWERGNEREP